LFFSLECIGLIQVFTGLISDSVSKEIQGSIMGLNESLVCIANVIGNKSEREKERREKEKERKKKRKG
jgi:hypothetical protein